eukprot:Em1041g2a
MKRTTNNSKREKSHVGPSSEHASDDEMALMKGCVYELLRRKWLPLEGPFNFKVPCTRRENSVGNLKTKTEGSDMLRSVTLSAYWSEPYRLFIRCCEIPIWLAL